MAGSARARTLARLARHLRHRNVDVKAAFTELGPRMSLATAAGLLASSAAVTTSWAAAADPNTPIPGPPTQPEPQNSSNDGTAQWRIFTDIARDLVREGKQAEAERYLKRALEAAKIGFGPTDPHVASACQNLAEIYRLQKKFDLAGPLYDQALAILGDSYGTKDIRVAFALHNVAGYYFSQRDWDKASQYYEQALQVKLASVGPGHTETSNTMFHLAEVRWAQGKRREALNLAGKSLDALDQQRASDAVCSRRRMRLADMLMEERRYSEAVPLLRKVLGEVEMEGVRRAPAAETLARALTELGEFAEAQELLEDSIKRRKEHGGGEHPATAGAIRKLAEVYLASIKSKTAPRPADLAGLQLSAMEMAQEAVTVAEKAYLASQEAAALRQSGDVVKALNEEKSWFSKLLSSGKAGESSLPKVLGAARPEIAALELSSTLITKSEVDRLLGGNNTQILIDLQRALDLVTTQWPGEKAPSEKHSSKIQELRHRGECRALGALWHFSQDMHGKKSAETKAALAALKQQGCSV